MLPKKCCVDTCQSAASREQDRGVTFHKLPKNPLRGKWLKQARLNPDAVKGKWFFICSRHFRKTDFEHFKGSKFVLKTGAIPTIFSWGSTSLNDLEKIFSTPVTTEKTPVQEASTSNTDSTPTTLAENAAPPESISKSDNKSVDKDKSDKDGEKSMIEDVVLAEIKSKLIYKDGKSNDLQSASDSSDNISDSGKNTDENTDNKAADQSECIPTNDVVPEVTESNATDALSATSEDNTFDKESTEDESVFRDQKDTTASEADETVNESQDENTESETSLSGMDSILNVINNTEQARAAEKLKAENEAQLFRETAAAISIVDKPKPCPMLKALIEKPSETPRIKSGSWSSSNSPDLKSMDTRKLEISGGVITDKTMLVPGTRVEAKDFSEQWYPAKVVEVDHEEMEVLIHYDNWSQRYDEWISMSSPRLRLQNITLSNTPAGPPIYVLGERCLARWSDNRRFPATVRKVLANGKYEVIFDDGFVRTLKWPMMFKARPLAETPSAPSPLTVTNRARKTATTLPAAPLEPTPPPVHNHLFDPSRDHLGSKEERRHMKRKLNVKELFSGKKRRAEKEDRRRSQFKKLKQPLQLKVPKIKEEIIEAPIELQPVIPEEAEPKPPTPPPPQMGAEESALLTGEWSCRWMNGRPVGTVLPAGRSGTASSPQRLERMAVQVADKRLPPGWTKHMTRRCVGSSAGKWDVVLVCPSGRRFRSRVEMRARLAEADRDELLSYHHCLLDFSVHRKLARRLGWDRSELNSNPTVKLEPIVVKTEYTAVASAAMESQLFPPSPSAILAPIPEQPLVLPALEDGFVYVGSLKVQIIENLLRCPKEGCFKNFRKNNLLQMHIKHYHRELQKFLGDTPNVADLAYARTIVENVVSPKIRASGEPKEPKPKERKIASTSGMLSPKLEFDLKSVKQEILTERAKTQSPLVFDNRLDTSTPTKTGITNLEELESSPKLRNALIMDVKPEPIPKTIIKIKQESSKSKDDDYKAAPNFYSQMESSSSTPVKSEYLKSTVEGKSSHKTKSSKKPKDPAKPRPNLIMKITGLGDKKRARSQSPSIKTEIKSEILENVSGIPQVTPIPVPKQKKLNKKRFADSIDMLNKKKRLGHSRIDIWDAFTADHDETRSSFGTSDQQFIPPPKPEFNLPMKMEQNVFKEEILPPTTIFTDTGEKIKIVHMKREEIINCHCGFGEEDGLMIQCELCLCWQHATCHSIERESQVPDNYICTICLHPPRARHSQRHLHLQDWLYEGRLARAIPPPRALAPRGSVPALDPPDTSRSTLLRRSHELSANLLQLQDLLHSMRCKIEVSEKKDHPKLYLWAKTWEDSYSDETKMNSKSIKAEKRRNKIKQEELSQGSSTQDEELEIEEGLAVPDAISEEITIKMDDVMENIEVSEIHGDITDQLDDIPKCDNEVELMATDIQNEEQVVSTERELENGSMSTIGSKNREKDDHGAGSSTILANLLASPGGTPIDFPISTSELETLAKSVQEPPKAPQPEAAIDPAECRMRLLQHVERTQLLLDARLNSIDAQIAELESLDPSLEDDETADSYPRTKQTIQMLLRDLKTMEELGMIC